FRLEEEFLARESFDGVGNPGKGGVGFGTVEVADALVIGIMDEPIELSLAQRLLHLATAAAGPHAETTESDAGVAQGDFVHSRAFDGRLGEQHPGRSQGQSTGGKGGTFEELAAAVIEIHGDVLPLWVSLTTASRTRFMSEILNTGGEWSIPQS